jgi:hypothetical protein
MVTFWQKLGLAVPTSVKDDLEITRAMGPATRDGLRFGVRNEDVQL